MIRNMLSFYGEELLTSPHPQNWNTASCRPFETAYSIHLQLHSSLVAWGR